MSVTAEQLSKSGAKGKDLDAIVREQILIIDDRLQRSERNWGRNILAHNLPTSFTFAGLEKKDAQRIIYTAIVRSVEERGFKVRLLLKHDCTTIYLEWVTDLNSDEIDAMNRLIRRVRIASAEDLEAFLSGAPPQEKETHPAMPGGPDPPDGGAPNN
jgi:hypothetical protein